MTDDRAREIVALKRAVEENIALRCLLGGGCDANEDGPHRTVVKNTSGEFCAECGEMTRNGRSKPWFNEDRLERAIQRLSDRRILQEQER